MNGFQATHVLRREKWIHECAVFRHLMSSEESGGYTSERFLSNSCPQKRAVDTRVNGFQATHVLRREQWIHEWVVFRQLMSSEERGGYMSERFLSNSCPQKREVDTRVGGFQATHVLRREKWIHE
ncbi:hypothetical protein ACQUWN_08885 [Rossellomorea aquimaris]|uniref:hypothetical protein n=1 Tax=Rossellomorea aquimaris TaxID=189382 RepID=UPI003D162DA7